MKIKISILLLLILLSLNCNRADKRLDYKSETLQIVQLADHTFQHISYLPTQEWGNVPCNGMIVLEGGEAIIFDAPVENSVSEELIHWVENEMNYKIKAVVATHFHIDCIGGLSVFHDKNIPSYGNAKTIQLVAKNGGTPPQNGFKTKRQLSVGKEKVFLDYFGEGHTSDNIVGYFPKDNALFGGCLIKSIGAVKGNLEDANIEEWSNTVSKVKAKYQDIEIVIPGHGNPGEQVLLDFTINLFKEK